MRCSKCNEYIPEGLVVKECPSCGNEVKENVFIESQKTVEESSILDDKTTKTPLTEKSKLTKKQEQVLEEKIEKGLKEMFIGSLVIGFFAFISFVIPARYIPSRRTHRFSEGYGNERLVDIMGVFPTLILIAVFALIMFSAIITHSKYFKIKKDLKLRNVTSFETKITDIREFKGDKEKEYNVYIEKNEAGVRKLNYLIREFPELKVGDNIKITIATISQVVLSTQKTSEKRIIRNYERK